MSFNTLVIFLIKNVLYKHNVFKRGDDLGELSETTWPDLYTPEEGLGDLAGTFSSRLLFLLFWY